MSPLTGLGVNLYSVTINVSPLRGSHHRSLLTVYCRLPTAYFSFFASLRS